MTQKYVLQYCTAYVGTSYEIETAPGEMAVKGQAWLEESDGFPLP